MVTATLLAPNASRVQVRVMPNCSLRSGGDDVTWSGERLKKPNRESHACLRTVVLALRVQYIQEVP